MKQTSNPARRKMWRVQKVRLRRPTVVRAAPKATLHPAVLRVHLLRVLHQEAATNIGFLKAFMLEGAEPNKTANPLT